MRRAALTFAACLAALACSGPADAQPAAPATVSAPLTVTGDGANLNITPKRLVFDRSRRSGSVYIYNQGTETAAFDISLIDRFMSPAGNIVAMDQVEKQPDFKPYADQVKSARDILQVSPRRVTLAPRQGQTIRLRLINSPTPLERGEYRSHLTVVTIPSRDAGVTAEAASAAAASTNVLRIQISTLFGLSIPIIARVGDVDARAAIENVKLEEIPPAPNSLSGRPSAVVTLDLVRLGSSSLYGNMEIRVAGQKRGDPLGLAKGVGVYPEVGRRSLRLALTRAPALGEKLEISFTDDDSSPGKVLAKVTP